MTGLSNLLKTSRPDATELRKKVKKKVWMSHIFKAQFLYSIPKNNYAFIFNVPINEPTDFFIFN